MSKDIIVKKGLNINLVGDATKTLDISKNSKYYSVYPEDFHGVFPKLTVKADEMCFMFAFTDKHLFSNMLKQLAYKQ